MSRTQSPQTFLSNWHGLSVTVWNAYEDQEGLALALQSHTSKVWKNGCCAFDSQARLCSRSVQGLRSVTMRIVSGVCCRICVHPARAVQSLCQIFRYRIFETPSSNHLHCIKYPLPTPKAKAGPDAPIIRLNATLRDNGHPTKRTTAHYRSRGDLQSHGTKCHPLRKPFSTMHKQKNHRSVKSSSSTCPT